MDECPYGSQYRQQKGAMRLAQMNSSSHKKGTFSATNLSDQKTPNGHPNSFLYRAHINMNELSQAEQKNLENELLGSQADDKIAQSLMQQYLLQPNQISQF